MKIRPSAWADRDAVAALVEAMGGHDDVTTGGSWTSSFAAAIQSSDDRVVVAERGGVVVGVAHLVARRSLVHGEREAWLGTLAVAPEARSTGVGRQLLDAVDREARLLGCSSIVLESSEWRLDAQRLYRATGFGEHEPARRFHRPVAATGADLVDRFLARAALAASAVAGAIAAGGEHEVGTGADGQPTKAVDWVAEAAVVAVLREVGVPIMSEEAGLVDGEPVRDGQPWIALDPLDGTRNLTRRHPPWAVSMGLVSGGVPLAGYVCDLSSGRRWWGVPGEGAWVDGRPATPRPGGFLVVPGTTPDDMATAVPPGFERLRMAGSTTVELCRVADGAAGAFADLDRGVVRVHDLAGPMAVLLGAGCIVLCDDGTVPRLLPDPKDSYRIVAAPSASDARALLARTVVA